MKINGVYVTFSKSILRTMLEKMGNRDKFDFYITSNDPTSIKDGINENMDYGGYDHFVVYDYDSSELPF